jgi:hypothetical protein
MSAIGNAVMRRAQLRNKLGMERITEDAVDQVREFQARMAAADILRRVRSLRVSSGDIGCKHWNK